MPFLLPLRVCPCVCLSSNFDERFLGGAGIVISNTRLAFADDPQDADTGIFLKECLVAA